MIQRIRSNLPYAETALEAFTDAAKLQSGSGRISPVDTQSVLSIMNTYDAGNPMTEDELPLLICDICKHTYSRGYRNLCQQHIEAFWKITNREFVSRNLHTPGGGQVAAVPPHTGAQGFGIRR